MKLLNRKIVTVAGLHGNEKMPVKALQDNKIDFVLGSPKGYEQDVRFTEQDLNASFGTKNKSYESKRAKEILREINKLSLVIDFHTTESTAEPFAIIVDKEMIPLAEITGLKKIVLMKHNIKKGHALINHRDGISIEAGKHGNKKSYDTTLKVLRNIKNMKKHPVILYEVFDQITEPGIYQNFKMHKSGFIPVLAGESEYERQGIYGLKARLLK